MHAVIETSSFIADCRNAGLSDYDVSEIVARISVDPSAGDIIPGTGGARKLRFAGRGKGKSGGYRTVSYFAGEKLFRRRGRSGAVARSRQQGRTR